MNRSRPGDGPPKEDRDGGSPEASSETPIWPDGHGPDARDRTGHCPPIVQRPTDPARAAAWDLLWRGFWEQLLLAKQRVSKEEQGALSP